MVKNQESAYDPVGFITGDKIECWALSQDKVSVTTVISVDRIKAYKDMKKIAIGIDFSKKTFDATIVRRDEYTYTELAYSKFNNDISGFKAFEKWVRTSLKGTAESRNKSEWIFCGEHTGTCSIPLCDFLAKKQYFMWLESALVIHRKCGIVREKNDRIDSRRIAEYALRNFSTDVKPYKLDSRDLKKLKSLYAAHDMLTKDKVSKTNQLKSGALDSSSSARHEIDKQLTHVKKALDAIDGEIKCLLSESQEFSLNFKLLNTFKGVGVITIACLIIRTRNFRDMRDPRELGCYIGVVPCKQQSGTSIDKPASTSRYRDKNANSLLTSCVLSAISNNNPIIRPYYDRLIKRGVHPNKARNNCKFKIINVLLAMLRNDTGFNMGIHGKSREKWHAEQDAAVS